MSVGLAALVKQWFRLDQNETTRSEIQKLWDHPTYENVEELRERMEKRIAFGTAGLRGRMGAGFARMNELVVIQTSQGLCQYVLKTVDNAKDRGVVVGYDHRYKSEQFALLTAAAFLGDGVKVYLYRGLVHTPLVPLAVSKLNAACGVMITASHNPKDDNGYKVYWQNAVQIIHPHDLGITAAIEANLEPKCWEVSTVRRSALCLDVTSQMKAAYFDAILSLSQTSLQNSTLPIKFVNTSMHGVGHAFVEQAWKIFAFPPFVAVEEQKLPDPAFPTVKFPNPEEEGALDLAMKTANESGALYVLAQDPDADRFTAAEKLRSGTWKAFTGDQIGTLLAAWTLKCYRDSGRPMDKLAMVASTVSSKMIEFMAQAERFKFVDSLTGFKYIGNTAQNLEKEGYNVPFGYEEAIGYMLDSGIKDKDGVAATVAFAEMVTWLHAQGETASGFLDQLYDKYGYFQTLNGYFWCSGDDTIDRIFTRLRHWDSESSEAQTYPSTLGGLSIVRVRDLTADSLYDSANPPSFKPDLPASGGHMISFRAKDPESEAPDSLKLTVTIRTSGTEPKIKYYLEASSADRSSVAELLERVRTELSASWIH